MNFTAYIKNDIRYNVQFQIVVHLYTETDIILLPILPQCIPVLFVKVGSECTVVLFNVEMLYSTVLYMHCTLTAMFQSRA